jgi:preprotein translocase subunit SecE
MDRHASSKIATVVVAVVVLLCAEFLWAADNAGILE